MSKNYIEVAYVPVSAGKYSEEETCTAVRKPKVRVLDSEGDVAFLFPAGPWKFKGSIIDQDDVEGYRKLLDAIEARLKEEEGY